MSNEYFETYGYPPFYEDERMYKMNNAELLSRIDERTLNIWATVEKLEAHQKEANGYIRDNMKQTTKNATWISALKYAVYVIIIAFISAITTSVIGVW